MKINIKKLVNTLVIVLVFYSATAYGQTSANLNQFGLAYSSGDAFSFMGNTVSHYGLGWYNESPTPAPFAYFSGYAGLRFFTEGQSRMFLDKNGNLGIGISSPQSKLQVNGGAVVVGTNSVITNADGHISIGNITEDSNPTQANWVPNTTFLLNASDYSSIGFHDSGTRVDFIRAGNGTIQLGYDGGWGNANIGLPSGIWNALGNVGIGTLSPREKLSVNGNIRAREVKVEATNWPDFVFREEYQLQSLRDIEKYIKANNHLPEIPSATEIEKDGVQLGEMNRLLLKKIEELTLHVINLDKKMTALEEENKNLKKK